MRKTTKKISSSKIKKETPVAKPANQYINIRETTPELQKKQTILWVLVSVFAVILIISWLVVLRININNESDQLSLGELSQQINESLAKFDTEIKSRKEPQPINIDDLDAIKTNLEEQLKSNPDSSLWPNHEFTKLNLVLQYPADWQKISDTKSLIIGDTTTTTDTIIQSGKLTITVKDNSKNLVLNSWIDKNVDLKNYQSEKPIFIFSSTTLENLTYLQINPEATSSTTLNRLYFINATTSKKVIEVKAESRGDDTYYQPLIEEIIRTIKLI